MNELNAETLPTWRAKWLDGFKRGQQAAAQLAKPNAKITAEAKAQLERERRDGPAYENKLRSHAGPEIAEFLASVDSRRRALFAKKIDLQGKIPRMITAERIDVARAELKQIEETFAAFDRCQADLDLRIITEEMPTLTDEERELILTPEQRIANRAAAADVMAENAHAAAALGSVDAAPAS